MKNILICLGTRPEWLKIKPLLIDLKNYHIFFTGQHEDIVLNEILNVTDKVIISEILNKSDNRLNNIISSIINNFPIKKFEGVIVQGDTASAYGCAIAAFNNNLKIFYIEAGLRSHNLRHPFPEEAYRQMITRISDVNFCPTLLSYNNLIEEKVLGENYVVGNTVLDNLKKYRDQTSYTNLVLITLHRRENLPILDDWLKQISKIANQFKSINFIVIEHPNHKINLPNLKNLSKSNPLNHEDFLNLLIKVKLLITDSGGLQEEGAFLNKKIIVCRKITERPEGIKSGHIKLCKTPAELGLIFSKEIKSYKINKPCPYGDGHASKKIIEILKK